jgi:hypothetical protein
MRLGRKLAEGVAVDREADRLAAAREPAEQQLVDRTAVVSVEDVPAEQPVRA